MEELLNVLEKNSRLNEEQLAVMLDKSTDEIKSQIRELENSNTILGYRTLINWEKTSKESVTALIEVRITPQRDLGFDKVAERIYRFPQVKACYLMSGGFDLTVVVEGKTMKEVALFVSEKLAPIDGVLSTATHFILKKFKESGVVFEKKEDDDREALVL